MADRITDNPAGRTSGTGAAADPSGRGARTLATTLAEEQALETANLAEGLPTSPPVVCGYCRAEFGNWNAYHLHAVMAHDARIPPLEQRSVILAALNTPPFVSSPGAGISKAPIVEALDALKWANDRLRECGKHVDFTLGMCMTLSDSERREAAARDILATTPARSQPVPF